MHESCTNGCWYCGVSTGGLEVCCEFDCYVHRSCVESKLASLGDNVDRECLIIAEELGIIPQGSSTGVVNG